MQRIMISVIGLFLAVTFCGCARIDFGKDGLTYYDPKPYLLVSTNKDCVTTATVVVLPDEKKSLKFIPGYGSADLSVSLSNGMITAAGQKTDTKIPETISAIADLGKAAGGFIASQAKPGKQIICTPSATLFPIEKGEAIVTKPIKFDVQTEVIDLR
jgi:hypothetical protein